MYDIQTKRAYAPVEAGDGYRVLVDRMWPRGITKEKLAVQIWNKLLAPSQSLCKSLANSQIDFSDFRKQYYEELEGSEHAHAFLSVIAGEIKTSPITLVYAAKDEAGNHAVLLKEWLEQNLA